MQKRELKKVQKKSSVTFLSTNKITKKSVFPRKSAKKSTLKSTFSGVEPIWWKMVEKMAKTLKSRCSLGGYCREGWMWTNCKEKDKNRQIQRHRIEIPLCPETYASC